MARWVGKTAVVVGASTGYSVSVAVSLAVAGLNVVCLTRKPHLVEELNKQVKAGKGKIFGKKCDVSSRKEVVEAFASINGQFGGINILVNNAARKKFKPVTGLNENTIIDDTVEVVMKTNMLGLIECSREGVKYMKQTGEQGHIINISSDMGYYVPAAYGLPRLNISYGTRQAVQATTEAMRLEFSQTKTNIKITCVNLGIVLTDIMARVLQGEYMLNNCSSKDISLDYSNDLESSDVAEAILSVIAMPPRVNISELTIRPLADTFEILKTKYDE